MTVYRHVCLYSLLAILCPTSIAQAQYRFDQWTADNGLPQNSVRGIVQTRDGYLWMTTFDGLVRFDGVRFTIFNKSNSPGIAGNRFVYIFEDRFGDLWAAFETGGLVRRRQGRFMTYTRTEGLPIDDPLYLSGDGDGNLIISYGARYFRWWEGRFQPADDYRPPAIQLPEGWGAKVFSNPALVAGKRTQSQAVSRDAAGGLWLTDLDSMQSCLLSPHPPEGLDYNSVYADNEGNYWFMTSRSGLFRARKQTVTAYAKAQGLNVKEVYPLLEARDGSIWIGTLGDGLFRLKDGAFTNYLSGGNVTSLYEDRAGQLWINGSLRFAQGRIVSEAWGKSPPNTSLLYSLAMCEDRAGSYWVGTENGVARILDGAMTYFTTKDGLAGNDTKVIINDTAGGLWIGSYGGLTHYKNGKFTAWTEKDGLPGNTVRALKQDGDGSLWIGTYDSGLGRLKDGRFTRYSTKDGLFDNGVFQILEDDYGWFWMSCNRGIYRVRKQELNDFADGRVKTVTCLAYNKGDGMPSAECNGGRWPAGFKARDGKLWFPTMGGVAVIDPANIRTNTQPPPVVIEEMRINNQPVPLEAWQSAIHNPESAIQIRPGQENFEIQYTALSFINSQNMRFKYNLEGADHDWGEAGTRRTAYFSHVQPGDYTFRVIAANSDGVWNLTGASVRITVIPPFWWRWWFITTVLLVVAGAIAGAWKYRIAQLQRIQSAQQAFARQLIASQERERKRIAGELHDSLGQSLVIIRNWALLGAGQLEKDAPAREELDEINAVTSRAINEVRDIAYNLGPYHLERLGLANSIRDMVKSVEKISSVAITTELDPIEGALSRETEMSLYRIAQEALNNVVKHSQAIEANVSLKRETSGVRLTVTDNGKGFNPQMSAPSDHFGLNGFGLNGIAERVRLLGGALTIRSAPGQGTTVEAVLPGASRV
jgi:signal transduction histidine kinase/ligand-binding sensor domain-containing protein